MSVESNLSVDTSDEVEPPSQFDDETIDVVDALASDMLARFRDGERPSVEEYARRHPELSDAIRHYFPLILSVERLKLDEESPESSPVLGGKRFEQLDDFRIVRELARGGMGVVFEAEQVSLERRVAVKVLQRRVLLDDAALERFRGEARTAARLHHPNIVPVLGAGTAEGVHYLAMQFVEGRSLDQWVEPDEEDGKPRRLAYPEVARIGSQVADALSYAHENGVLHRDVKPANLVLQEDGTVQLTDFGLAQATHPTEVPTPELVGSLRYLPPERVRGVSDERGDVYGLGLTLYELCLGRPAFDAAPGTALLRQVEHEPPAGLRDLQADVPRDLATIIEKAIQPEPESRYSSAAELRNDLNRFLADEPIKARPVSLLERVVRWSRRNPLLASTTAIAVLGLVTTTVASTVGYLLAKNANERTNEALQHSERTVELALDSLNRVVDSVSIPVNSVDGTFDGGPQDVLPVFTLDPSPHTAELLERIQPLYEELSKQVPDDDAVRLQAADAAIRLARIQYQLGRTSDALLTIERCRSQLDAGAGGQHASVEVQLRRARAGNELGLLLAAQQILDEAVTAHESVLEDVQQALDSPWARVEAARAHLYLSELGTRQRLDGAPDPPSRDGFYDHANDAVTILAATRDSIPDDWTLDVWFSRALLSRARWGRDRDAASRDTETGIGTLRKRLSATEHPMVRFELIRALAGVRVRGAQDDREKLEAARARLAEALEQSLELGEQYPKTPYFTRIRVHIRHKLAAIARLESRWDDMEAQLSKALELQSGLVADFPDSVHDRCWRALLYRSMAEQRRRMGQTTESAELLARGTADLDAIEEHAEGIALFQFARRELAEARVTDR